MYKKLLLLIFSYILFQQSLMHAQWVRLVKLNNSTVYSIVVNGTNIFAGTAEGVYVSTNNGSSWTAANSGLSSTEIHVLALGGTTLYAGSSNGVQKSVNNGATWTNSSLGMDAFTSINTLAISGSNIYAGALYNGVYYSSNSGGSWTNPSTGRTVTSLVLNGFNLFAATDNGIYLSTNNGSTFTAINSGLGIYERTYARLTVNGTTVYAATSGGVYKTIDNGTTWIAINPGLVTSAFALAFSGTNIFVASNGGGIFLSKNGGNWTAVNTGLTSVNITSLTIIGTNLFAGSYIGEIYIRPLSDLITDISDNKIILPSEYMLLQNYPNPFNPSATIIYSLPRDSKVKIEVYSVLGQKIKTILDEFQSAGYHQIIFEGKNLSSGIYFYRIEAGEYSATKKFVLLK